MDITSKNLNQSDDVSEKIVIRVNFNNEYRFLILDHDSFSLDGFMNAGKQIAIFRLILELISTILSVQKKFQINGDLRVNASLKDNLGTPISVTDFCTVVKNYRKSSCFYVQLEYNIVQQNPTNITAEVRANTFL